LFSFPISTQHHFEFKKKKKCTEDTATTVTSTTMDTAS